MQVLRKLSDTLPLPIVLIVKGGLDMSKSLLRTNKEIVEIYERHKRTLYRICFVYMKNHNDAEDTVQDTFVQLIKKAIAFENEEHEKAWLIKTATNLCKNRLRHWWRKHENLEDYKDLKHDSNIEAEVVLSAVFSAVIGLPDKYKTVVYLYYYEGYDSVEIAEILNKPPSTVRNHLHEARKLLKKKLGGDYFEE